MAVTVDLVDDKAPIKDRHPERCVGEAPDHAAVGAGRRTMSRNVELQGTDGLCPNSARWLVSISI
jgi:hypothetical protein